MTDGLDVQLSDLLESYPSSMTPGFQTLLTAKKEFYELASDPNERLPPGKGQYFKHQKLSHRFLRAYDKYVVLSETGTGKTCEIDGFIEYIFSEVSKNKLSPGSGDEKASHFKRAVCLFKGSTQKNEIRSQIICKCSDGHYLTPMVLKAKSETVQKTNLSLELKKAGYIISTYTSFANRIAEKYPKPEDDARLAEDYADTIFWIDEAHNLLIDPGVRKNMTEKEQTYHTLWRILHLARRSKVIISTATPMINDANEIGSLMNLVLPVNGILPPDYDYRNAPANDIRVLFPKLPFDPKTATPSEMAPYFQGQFPPNYNFKTATLQDLEPYFRGKIGFVRSADIGVQVKYQGVPQDDEYEIDGIKYKSQLIIYATQMSQHQSDGYQRAQRANGGKDELYGAERQASNFVFPDGYWGTGVTEEEKAIQKEAKQQKARVKKGIKEGEQAIVPATGVLPGNLQEEVVKAEETDARAFRRYVTSKGDSYTATEEFKPWLTQIDYIRNLSCKYAEICRLVRDEPGNAFVYNELIDGSGIAVLSLCLEGLGFVRYNESSSMFLGVGGETVKPVCAVGAETRGNRRVRPDILSRQQGGPLRYALLTGETSDAKFASMMEAMNSYENRHGDYIKVLISSRVGRDGINVNNVLQIHLIGSEWNQSGIYQAMSRGIRATSHDDLLNEGNEKIVVNVYEHAAVASDNSSIDLYMYRTAEYKDRGIKRIMRIMKQSAIGCQIHYNRNVRPGDKDGSAACDYDECKYQCVDPAPDSEDYTTYDVLYSGESVNNAMEDIINIYRQRNSLTLADIEYLIPQYRRKFIIMALEFLISNKVPLIDRFGYTTYLREDKASFYLDREYPTDSKASYPMAYYSQGVIGIEQKSLSNIVVEMEAGEHLDIMARLELMNPEEPEFENILANMSIEGQATILEAVLQRYAGGEQSPFIDAIIDKYRQMIFVIHDPITELTKAYERANQKIPRPGRKPKQDGKQRTRKLKPIMLAKAKIEVDEDTEVVYLHNLYTQVINLTGYATVARYNKAEGRLRLLKLSEDDKWRDLNQIEFQVYNAFLQIEIANRRKEYEKHGIYAVILTDGKFRIVSTRTQSAAAVNDARHVNRGKVCKFWDKPDLIDICYEFKITPPLIQNIFTEEHRQQLINYLLGQKINKSPQEMATWDLDRLVYYYKWYNVGNAITRPAICDMIQASMEAAGLVYR